MNKTNIFALMLGVFAFAAVATEGDTDKKDKAGAEQQDPALADQQDPAPVAKVEEKAENDQQDSTSPDQQDPAAAQDPNQQNPEGDKVKEKSPDTDSKPKAPKAKKEKPGKGLADQLNKGDPVPTTEEKTGEEEEDTKEESQNVVVADGESNTPTEIKTAEKEEVPVPVTKETEEGSK